MYLKAVFCVYLISYKDRHIYFRVKKDVIMKQEGKKSKKKWRRIWKGEERGRIIIQRRKKWNRGKEEGIELINWHSGLVI